MRIYLTPEIKAKESAETYGKSIERTITQRQIHRMEHDNQVPLDMSKRKLIARLLNIPPALFGLAVLENSILQPYPEIGSVHVATAQTKLMKVVVDTTKYQKNIRVLLNLHDMGQVQSELAQMNADIRNLSSLESQTHGDLQYHIQELLFSYHLLAARVVRDQRQFNLSHNYANQAVRVAKATKDIDMIATALYTRGCTYLEWGRNGTLKGGVFEVQLDMINNAIRDFEDAKQVTKNREKSLHPQIVGRIDMSLSRAYAIRCLSTGENVPVLAITLLDEAEEKADNASINDPYERHLVTGSPIGFVKGEYHNSKARGLTIVGRPGAALNEITALESLRNGRIGKQFTRNQIWLDIVAADVYMGLEQYEKVAERAKRALLACQDINSVAKFACLVDIHGRLLQSTYKAASDVEELGEMIHETITHRIQQEEDQLVMEKDY